MQTPAELDNHKRILGILYVVTSCLQILVLFGVGMLLSTIFEFAAEEADEEGRRVLEIVGTWLPSLLYLLVFLIAIPSLIAGIGLLTRQSWALTVALVVGCLKLLSFPVGTCIGVYSIWIYSQHQKSATQA
ncbi:MAG: hypothetical protein K1X47_04075 [Cyclobacteriaceae bacterium]|nr:hypothetical protein [Cyclobacteriaceae bacterium]